MIKVLYIFIVLLFAQTCSTNTSTTNMEENEKYTTSEVPQNESPAEGTKTEHDFVVAEAAVGRYNDVTFTVAGFTKNKNAEESQWTSYLDIEKSKFVDIIDGTEFDLNDDIKVKVLRLEKEEGLKGKVYFKVIN